MATSPRHGRLGRLLPLLESDPDNLRLLVEAAETALAEQRPEVAADLLARRAAIEPLPPPLANVAGLAALQLQRFEEARDHFETVFAGGVEEPSVRFNLAWTRAMLDDADGALALIDEPTARALPQAAMLQVRLLHKRGALETAERLAPLYAELHFGHPGLMAALSVLAIDLEDESLAARCAAAAGDHPDALATLGTLALGSDDPAEARRLFERALAGGREVPRAVVGRGLARMMAGEPRDAAMDLDRGAQMFGDHLGSWIAAGWAHFTCGDTEAARARFEKALELDPTFAESHGSLAVVDILGGDLVSGRERIEIALRLDRQCYSAALARVLIAAGEGDSSAARRIFDLAVNTPVDEGGRTIAQALARAGIAGAL